MSGFMDTYKPNVSDHYLHVNNGDGIAPVTRGYPGRFGNSPKIIVLHIMQGSLWGSYQHFHSVPASSTVGIGKLGAIWRYVPEDWGPWTNGDYDNPTALGLEFMRLYGADLNPVSLTIETEGFTDEWPRPQAQLDAVVWQIVTWMRKYNIPLRNVIRHADINSADRRYCPGDAYYNLIIQRVKDVLNETSTPPAPVYAAAQPVLVNGAKWDGKADVIVNGAQFFSDPRKVTVIKETPVNVFATSQSALTRGPVKVGEEFNVLGWVRGEKINGEDRWWITKYFSRIHVAATEDKPEDGADSPPEQLPGGALIYMGKVYYPARLGDQPRVLTVTNKANLRKGASLSEKIVGVVQKGDEITVEYWCFGDDVRGENVWWILADKRGAIQHGARVYATATSGRPE